MARNNFLTFPYLLRLTKAYTLAAFVGGWVTTIVLAVVYEPTSLVFFVLGVVTAIAGGVVIKAWPAVRGAARQYGQQISTALHSAHR